MDNTPTLSSFISMDIEQLKLNQIKETQSRVPRIFFGVSNYIKEYNKNTAIIIENLKQKDRDLIHKLKIMDVFPVYLSGISKTKFYMVIGLDIVIFAVEFASKIILKLAWSEVFSLINHNTHIVVTYQALGEIVDNFYFLLIKLFFRNL